MFVIFATGLVIPTNEKIIKGKRNIRALKIRKPAI